ncbi:hypothetical protein BDZ89DRAFT_1070887 [Hymenopellis radicata]|nr:hypothetical protein BDZ89DRAFT_1070887 [Hymenopellis radicata]
MSMAQKILRLLSEAGFIYFLVNTAFILIMSLSSHTNGTSAVVTLIFTDVMPHVSVIIPVMTFILVLSYGSLWEVTTDSTRVTPVQFTTLPPSTLMRTSTRRSEVSEVIVEIGPEKDGSVSEARSLNTV